MCIIYKKEMADYIRDIDCQACFNYMAMENGNWNVVLAKLKKNDIPEIEGLYKACGRCYDVCDRENRNRRLSGREMSGCYEGVGKFALLTKKKYEELMLQKCEEIVRNQ
jgi:hypothetical protein